MNESQIRKYAPLHMLGKTAFVQECHDGAVISFEYKEDAINYFLREQAVFELVLYDGAGADIAHKTPNGYYYR